VRYENYSDFGSTTNGKFATRYTVARGLVVRGAASTGFRARRSSSRSSRPRPPTSSAACRSR
jgi:hypothetical protein